ncbi:MAG: putative glycoside hydrolase [Oscillospiraceae bacterium]|jgi:hypothetical protein|nr:putative glycoside hydrolase [Oscillospiraceae bacterium]
MSKRGYGKKIKRSKNLYKNQKSRFRTIVEFAVTAAAVAGLCFVGYTIAATVFNYERPQGGGDVTESAPTATSGGVTGESGETPGVSESGSDAEPPPYKSLGKTVYARLNVLSSPTSLSAFIEEAKSEGYDAVVVELKDEDGRLLYKSGVAAVAGDGDIIAGTLTAKQIAESFSNAGIRPIARINTLKDRLAPAKIKDVSYRFADGNSAWLDDRPENGGKFWANPFLQGTADYISDITAELYEAGFGDVIYANVVFPDFRKYDLTILSRRDTDEKTRFSALADFVNKAAEKSPGVNIYIEMSAGDVISGGGPVKTAEILRAGSSFSAAGAVLIFSRAEKAAEATGGEVPTPEELTELVRSVFEKAEKQTGELEIIPCADVSGLSESDVGKVISAFLKMGYENYMTK